MLARYERNCPKKKNNVGANGSNRGQDFFRLTQSDPENWYESPLNSTFLCQPNLFFWLAGWIVSKQPIILEKQLIISVISYDDEWCAWLLDLQ